MEIHGVLHYLCHRMPLKIFTSRHFVLLHGSISKNNDPGNVNHLLERLQSFIVHIQVSISLLFLVIPLFTYFIYILAGITFIE